MGRARPARDVPSPPANDDSRPRVGRRTAAERAPGHRSRPGSRRGGGGRRRCADRDTGHPPRPSPGRPSRRDAVHLPRPRPLDRSRTDPSRRALPGRGGLGVPPPRPPDRRRSARWTPRRHRRPVRAARPLRLAAYGARRDRRPPRDRRLARGRGVRRQRLGRPCRGPPRGPGFLREEQHAPAPGVRIVVRPRLGGHRRGAPADGRRRAERSGRGMRRLHPVPRRLPDRRAGRARRARRPPLPGLVGAGPGNLPGRVPRSTRRPPLRVRRVPGGLSDQPAGRPATPSRRARARCGGRRRPARAARGQRRGPARRPRAVVHPRARSALPAAQRAGRARQRGRRRRPGDRLGARPLGRLGRPAPRRARAVGRRPTGEVGPRPGGDGEPR